VYPKVNSCPGALERVVDAAAEDKERRSTGTANTTRSWSICSTSTL
jgi:hypothetical protein